MKKAIITGASGFVGSTLVNHLLKNNYVVLALGRSKFNDIKLCRLKEHENLYYQQLNMSRIDELPGIIRSYKNISFDNSIFYHFAWSGFTQLSDLNVDYQLKNVIWSEMSLKVALSLKCSKYIFVGTMEEIIAKKYLELNHKYDNYYNRHN